MPINANKSKQRASLEFACDYYLSPESGLYQRVRRIQTKNSSLTLSCARRSRGGTRTSNRVPSGHNLHFRSGARNCQETLRQSVSRRKFRRHLRGRVSLILDLTDAGSAVDRSLAAPRRNPISQSCAKRRSASRDSHPFDDRLRDRRLRLRRSGQARHSRSWRPRPVRRLQKPARPEARQHRTRG